MKTLSLPDWQAIFYEEKNVCMFIVDAGDKQVIRAKPTNKPNQLALSLVDKSNNLYNATLTGFPDHYGKAIKQDRGFVLQMGKGQIVKNNVKIESRV